MSKIKPHSVEHSLRRSTVVFYEDHFEKNGAVEVSEWVNGEGFDFTADGNDPVLLTWQQWDALLEAVKQYTKHDWKAGEKAKLL